MLKIQNDVLTKLDSNSPVVLALLDLSSAFDTINHDILICRLEKYYGITGSALRLIQSYLDDRWQSVLIRDTRSDSRKLKCGVPQGSTLGPLLFTLYIQPLCDHLRDRGLSFHMYADDLQVYIACPTPSTGDIKDSLQMLERNIVLIRKWMRQNRLRLNNEKTELILFGTTKMYNDIPNGLSINVGVETISCKSPVKNLGVLMDKNLSFDSFINDTVKKCFSTLSSLFKIRKYLDIDTSKMLFQCLIMSRLDYCNSVLKGTPKKLLTKLERIQNVGARFIFRLERRSGTSSYKCRLHWLPIAERIDYKLLTIIYKCLNDDCAPEYLTEMFGIQVHTRDLRSNYQTTLARVTPNYVTIGGRSLSVTGPLLWNNLSVEARTSQSINIFKKNIKTYLFRSAYYNIL
jgi:hypothetical protein